MSDESLLAELKQQIASGNLVIIAGTGVSRPACDNQHVDGFAVATWPGLLQHGVVRCVERGVCDAEEASLLNLQIASKKTSFMVSAATEVSQRLKENPRSTGDYRHWLNDTIGELKPSSPAILHALDKIPALLATLNYDTLLEQATGRTAYTWQQDNQVGKVLRGELPRAVLHLHGVYDEPDSVVLGFDSYSRVKDAKHTQAILRYFTMGKTLLFVGCGATIEDPNFHQLLIWAREALAESAHKHYYLCHPSELVAKQQELPSWLRPLDYPDKDDFTGLLPFLQGLIPPPSPQTPPPALESQLGIEVTALEVAGEWGRALEIYLKLIGLVPSNATYLRMAGRCEENLRNIDSAINYYQLSLNLDPASYPAIRNLAFALIKALRLDEAILHIQTAVRTFPNDACFTYLLGRAHHLRWSRHSYALADDYGRAIEQYEDCVEKTIGFEWNIYAVYYLGALIARRIQDPEIPSDECLVMAERSIEYLRQALAMAAESDETRMDNYRDIPLIKSWICPDRRSSDQDLNALRSTPMFEIFINTIC